MFGDSKILVFGAGRAVATVSGSIASNFPGVDQSTAIMLSIALARTTGMVFLCAGLAGLGRVTTIVPVSELRIQT